MALINFKRYLLLFFIYIFFFLIGDVILSNFFYDKNLSYACYKYSKEFYNLKSNCSSYERWEIRKNKPFKVDTDKNGYRHLGKERFKKERETIAFLGDSQTYGLGLEYRDTFVGKVEKKYDNYNVLNLAVPSYSPTVYNYTLKQLLKRKVYPSKIVLVLDIGDVYQEFNRWSLFPGEKKPKLITKIHKKKEDENIKGWKKIRRENFKITRIIIYNLKKYLKSIKIFFTSEKDKFHRSNKVEQTHFAEFTYKNKNDLNKNFWDNESLQVGLRKVSLNLSDISKLSKKINSEFYILIYPWPETLEYGQNYFNWEKFVEDNCIKIKCTKVINLYSIFRHLKNNTKDFREKYFLNDDIHSNEKSNKIIYNEIIKEIFED